MIILLPMLALPPTGLGDPRPDTPPPPIDDITLSADRVSWTYDEPLGFDGYLVRSTGVAGRSWETSSNVGTLREDTFVFLRDLPIGTVEVLVKPFANGLESLREARQSLSVGGGPVDLDTMVPAANLPQYIWGTYPAFLATKNGIAAISTANPGDLIELDDGTYTSGFNCSRSGTSLHPIVIRAKNKHKAIVTGNVSITGDWVSVDGMMFRGAPSRKVEVLGHHCRITRSKMTAMPWGDEDACVYYKGNFFHFDRNESTETENNTLRWQETALDPWVERNWVHKNRSAVGAGHRGTEHNEQFQFGITQRTHPMRPRIISEWNLMEDFGEGIDKELFSVKTSGGIYYQNTFRNNGIAGYTIVRSLQNRGGQDNTYIANTFIGHELTICARGHKLISNQASGAGDGIILSAGTIEVADGGQPPPDNMARCIDIQMADNRGDIFLGDPQFKQGKPGASDLGPRGTVFSRNQPNRLANGNEVHSKTGMKIGIDNGDSIFDRDTNFKLYTPKPLTTAQVGPDYPEPGDSSTPLPPIDLSLASPYTDRWKAFVPAQPGSAVAQITDGVRCTGGAYDNLNSMVRVWNKFEIKAGTGEIFFNFKVRSYAPVVLDEGSFFLVGFARRTRSGQSASPFLATDEMLTQDTAVAPELLGFRVSIATNSPNPANSNGLRGRRYPGRQAIATVGTDKTFNFIAGTTYSIRCKWLDDTFRLAVESGPTVLVEQVMSDPVMSDLWAAGLYMFVGASYGADGDFSAAQLVR